jgi:hypothetical protein
MERAIKFLSVCLLICFIFLSTAIIIHGLANRYQIQDVSALVTIDKMTGCTYIFDSSKQIMRKIHLGE